MRGVRRPAGAGARRVLILTASVGEGHASAARALAAELAAESPQVEVVVQDILAAIGWVLRTVLRDLYRVSLGRCSCAYGLGYLLLTHLSPLRALGRLALGLLGGRALLRLIRAHEPDVVVSTYPAASAMLGQLRRRGRLHMPVVTTITDLAGVVFWADSGVDLHLVMHDCCISPVEREAGQGSVRRVRPLVARSFFDPLPRAQARRQLDLPDGPLVVVSGGGWGVGDLVGAVSAALAVDGATVVALAGRREQVRRQLEGRFEGEERVLVVGFTEEMSALLAAADVLVHSTGGVTCLEALVRGCPIIVYGALPGHMRLVAGAMASLGLAQAPHSPDEFVVALRRVLARPWAVRPVLPPAPSAASLVLAARARTSPLPAGALPSSELPSPRPARSCSEAGASPAATSTRLSPACSISDPRQLPPLGGRRLAS